MKPDLDVEVRVVKDIRGTDVFEGDTVYYARKCNYTANGELIKCKVTKIHDLGGVSMSKYFARSPKSQIIKV